MTCRSPLPRRNVSTGCTRAILCSARASPLCCSAWWHLLLTPPRSVYTQGTHAARLPEHHCCCGSPLHPVRCLVLTWMKTPQENLFLALATCIMNKAWKILRQLSSAKASVSLTIQRTTPFLVARPTEVSFSTFCSLRQSCPSRELGCCRNSAWPPDAAMVLRLFPVSPRILSRWSAARCGRRDIGPFLMMFKMLFTFFECSFLSPGPWELSRLCHWPLLQGVSVAEDCEQKALRRQQVLSSQFFDYVDQ